MSFRWAAFALLLFPMVFGCSEARPEPPDAPSEPPPHSPNLFNPNTAGTIRGHVTWQGLVPHPSPYRVSPLPIAAIGSADPVQRNNPNCPIVDPATQAVGNAVVFLRGVDPRRGRPWDHKPVEIELSDYRIHVGQPMERPAYAFVCRGDPVRIVSRQPVFHALHADGASFFTLPFPDPNEPLTRRLTDRGVVELSSAAGYFWMRAYLFVDEHPYYAVTSTDGSFELRHVPPGDYELVCWMPNWIEDRRNRDPEGGLVMRMFYRPAVEIVQAVRVGKQETRETQFNVSAAAFEGSK